jgi:steroid delta-isomerase-like uncharacterized protein
MSTVNKAVVRRYIEEVLNREKTAIIDELIALNFIGHDPLGPDIHGPEGVKQRQALYRSSFPDLLYTVEEMVAEDDAVVWRWTAHGTHKGEIMGVAPTRKQVTIVGTMTCHLVDGKLQEAWNNWDVSGLLRQLGTSPQLSRRERKPHSRR